MNQQVAKLILIAVAVTGARGAQAFQFESTAASCPKSGETWVCSEAFTKVNIAEATTVDEVTVEAQLSGPNYFAHLKDSSDVLLAISSTWKIKVNPNPSKT